MLASSVEASDDCQVEGGGQSDTISAGQPANPSVQCTSPVRSVPQTSTQQTLQVHVRRHEVILAPGLNEVTKQSWPAVSGAISLSELRIRIDVDVLWPGGSNAVFMTLEPQAGAVVRIGGPVEDVAHWTSFLVTGEQVQSIEGGQGCILDGSGGGVLRATSAHSWEEDTTDDESNACMPEADAVAHTDFPSQPHASMSSCLMGFSIRVRLTVTVMVYPATGSDSSQTLVVNGAGSLGLQPCLADLHHLRLPFLIDLATEDFKRGEYALALQKWQVCLPLQERLARGGCAREGAKLATMLHQMGVASSSLGNVREALPCLRRALALRQHLHGEEHPDSARTLQALGAVRVRDGEYHEAFEYLWQALRYYEAFDPESLEAASALQAVAGVYGKLGEFSEALECYTRALAIRERELGRDQLDVATTLHNMGIVAEKQHDHSEALESLHRALDIRERRLGPWHPTTARTLHSIGIVYSQLPDYDAALRYYRRALAICERRPGEGTHAAATLNNMGVIYAKLGQTQQAMEHHWRALAIQDKLLGPGHSDTAATRYNLHVLEAEIEAERRSLFDRLRNALSGSAGEPSLLNLLCAEAQDPDGPIDEPLCSCACVRRLEPERPAPLPYESSCRLSL